MEKIKKSEIKALEERAIFWEKKYLNKCDLSEYYKEELGKAHTLIGRIIHQLSERWDSVNLTEYFPTNNLHNSRSIENPLGKKSE